MDNSTKIKDEIKGIISATMANSQTLDDFCMQHIADYNRNRFEALAIRLFVGNETIITIYALDKIRQQDSTVVSKGSLPVKKFKLTDLSLSSVLTYFSSFNCTLSTGNYDIDDIEVMNK